MAEKPGAEKPEEGSSEQQEDDEPVGAAGSLDCEFSFIILI